MGIKADPKPEIQWFKGMDKIQDSAKFSQKFTTLKESNEYEIALEIQDPSAEDGGDYKCIVKNEHGQLQAKLNLNIEAEPTPEEEEEAAAPEEQSSSMTTSTSTSITKKVSHAESSQQRVESVSTSEGATLT